MKPAAIAAVAKLAGLQIIGICDHNSTRNAIAVKRACELEGITAITGIEICSEEEVHILGLFEDGAALESMQAMIDGNLSGENNAAYFGNQRICDKDDNVVGEETKLLVGATSLKVDQIVQAIHESGGLAIASHVDRDRFSLIAQLGFVPEGMELDAMEISPMNSPSEAVAASPQISGYPLIRASDAHQLVDIGRASSKFMMETPSFDELRKAFKGLEGRKIEI